MHKQLLVKPRPVSLHAVSPQGGRFNPKVRLNRRSCSANASVVLCLWTQEERGSSDSHSSEELRSCQARYGDSQPHTPRRAESETGLLDTAIGPPSPGQSFLLQQQHHHQCTPTHSRGKPPNPGINLVNKLCL